MINDDFDIPINKPPIIDARNIPDVQKNQDLPRYRMSRPWIDWFTRFGDRLQVIQNQITQISNVLGATLAELGMSSGSGGGDGGFPIPGAAGASGGFDASTINTLPLVVQPFFGRRAWTAQWGTWAASTSENSGIPNTGTTTGTLGAVTPALTNTFTRQPRRKHTSAAGAGSACGNRNSDVYLCGSGGYCFTWRGGVNDAAAVANARWAVGVRAATAAVANADPSSFIDVVCIGADTGDTNLQLMHNDGSGTCTKTNLGSNFPANTIATDFFEIQIIKLPAGTLYVGIRNLTNQQETITQITSANVPADATGLGFFYWRNNGTTALAVELHTGTIEIAVNLE